MIKNALLKKSARKKAGTVTGILLLLLFMLYQPAKALSASRSGMNLWLNTLIPTLLPFLILTGMLIRTGTIRELLRPLESMWAVLFGLSPCGAYALLTGLVCGYPVGARITSDLYRSNLISRKEARYLLTFCNHASPVFIRTYLTEICLGGSVSPLAVTGILLGSALPGMLFFRFGIYKGRTCSEIAVPKKETSNTRPQGTLLDVSIMDSFETITRLGGYILLFSILSAMMQTFLPTDRLPFLLLCSGLELTTGLDLLAGAGLPAELTAILAAALTAFGGLCVTAQTKSLTDPRLGTDTYTASKLLQTVCCILLMILYGS